MLGGFSCLLGLRGRRHLGSLTALPASPGEERFQLPQFKLLHVTLIFGISADEKVEGCCGSVRVKRDGKVERRYCGTVMVK